MEMRLATDTEVEAESEGGIPEETRRNGIRETPRPDWFKEIESRQAGFVGQNYPLCA